MKTIIAIIGALALFTATATAQTYASQSIAHGLTLTTTAGIVASTGSNITCVIDCRKQANVALQLELMNDASGAANFGFHFQRSVDGVNYEPLSTLLIAFNGVTKQTVITNLASYGAGYIKIPYVTNAHGTINCTNLVMKYGVKIQAP